MNLNNLRIGARLGAAFALLLLLMGAMVVIGLLAMARINVDKDAMRSAAYKHQLTEQWVGAIASNSVRAYALVKTNSVDDARFFEQAMKGASGRITAIQSELEPLITSEAGKRLVADVATARKHYAAVRDQVLAAKAASEGSPAGVADQLIKEKMLPAMETYIAKVKQLAAFQDELVRNANSAIEATYTQGRWLLIGLGIGAFILASLLAVVLTRSITVPLARAVAVAETVARGDLTGVIDGSARDEVGRLLRALNAMNGSLLATVSEVRAGSETISTAAREIAAGNLDLSVRTEQQASSLEETAASLEELTSTVKQNADNAQQANSLAMSASQVAQRGGAVVAEVVATMASINTSSREIADIVGVIDSIAFQTNILALNAAVEAARAGEQGRGFAVVASEVRTLAQRSAAAAKEIKTLIDNSVRQVQTGGTLVADAGATMGDIVASISRVTTIMGDIANASVEQTLGIEQINAAITQMDEVTQQNAALVEEAAGAAAELETQAGALANAVQAFTVTAVRQAHVGGLAAPRQALIA